MFLSPLKWVWVLRDGPLKELVFILAELRETTVVTYQPDYFSVVK